MGHMKDRMIRKMNKNEPPSELIFLGILMLGLLLYYLIEYLRNGM